MITTEAYQKTINSLYKSFYLVLEEIGKTFPLYKLYPDSSAYKEEYQRDVSNLENIKSEIFLIMTKLQNDVANLSKTTNDSGESDCANNTGHGGHGANHDNNRSGGGGSGICVIRYDLTAI